MASGKLYTNGLAINFISGLVEEYEYILNKDLNYSEGNWIVIVPFEDEYIQICKNNLMSLAWKFREGDALYATYIKAN